MGLINNQYTRNLCISRCLDLSDLYPSQDSPDFQAGMRAVNSLRRIADCIEVDLKLPVADIIQWTEERIPNKNKYSREVKWPVGLIIVSGLDRIISAKIAEETDRLREYPEFRNYHLGITLAENSLSGLKSGSLRHYEHSIIADKETEIRSYRQATDLLGKKFPEIKKIGDITADFIELEGYDSISGARIYLDLGNRPSIVKQSAISSFFHKNGQIKEYGLVPKIAVSVHQKN